jgi:lysophospholipase L1-like esterase
VAALAVFVPVVSAASAFEPMDDADLDRLAAQTGFRSVAIERPCRAGPDGRCATRALATLPVRLRRASEDPFRILLLGDSHVASDYITGMARHRLQRRFGDAGRGLVQPDQSSRYGGRRLFRSAGWKQERIVDAGQAGKSFGLTGLALETQRAGARLVYRVDAADDHAEIHFEARRGGAMLEVQTGTVTHRLSSRADRRRVAVWQVPVGSASRLVVRALGRGLRIFGVAFSTSAPGVLLEVMGPVGAESQVYLQMDRASFVQHLALRAPDLVVFMLGGNDALKVRKGWWTLERVEGQYRRLFGVVQSALPHAECLVLTPMDAGVRRGGSVVSRAYVAEVRDLLRRVAFDAGCAVWDVLEAMGGPGSIERWVEAGIINPHDLLHPRKGAADLLGRGLAVALERELMASEPSP